MLVANVRGYIHRPTPSQWPRQIGRGSGGCGADKGVVGVMLCSSGRVHANFLEQMQKERLSSAESNKHKSTVDEIDLLKSKRSHLESDIKDLTSCADDFSVRAEQDRDFADLRMALPFVTRPQEKAIQLSAVQSDLDGMLKVLKGVCPSLIRVQTWLRLVQVV